MVTLDDWCVVVEFGSPYQAPELNRPALRGKAYGHPIHRNGTYVSTSRLLGLDTEARRAETKSRAYKLGNPDSEWLEWLEKNGYKMKDFDIKKDRSVK